MRLDALTLTPYFKKQQIKNTVLDKMQDAAAEQEKSNKANPTANSTTWKESWLHSIENELAFSNEEMTPTQEDIVRFFLLLTIKRKN